MTFKTIQILLLTLVLTGASFGLESAAVSIPSLEGTTPDGRLVVDEKGDLVVDAELRHFFDYFLSARGEVTDDVLRGRVAAVATEQLPAAAADRASELFDLYLRYVDSARSRLEMDPERVAEAYRTLMSTRAEVLGSEVAGAFFGRGLGTELATLALQKAMVDADDPASLRAAKSAWEASLSEQEKVARATARKPLDVSRRVASLRAAGVDEAEIRALRVREFGEQAADRLAELDHLRVEWTRRVANFRAQREALLGDPSLDAEARQEAVEALLDASFSETEQRRLRALDRL